MNNLHFQSNKSEITREFLKLFTFILFLSLLFFGYNSQKQSFSTLKNDDILKLLYWQAPTILNPHLSNGLKDWEASRISLEPLASFDNNEELIPFLAAKIPSIENGGIAKDGKSVIWQLKQGIKWSDGTPFTATDVVFTYQYINNPRVGSITAGNYKQVESVEALDKYTVKVNFQESNPAWFIPFVGHEGMILPKHILEKFNGANAREAPANFKPIGTGPEVLTVNNT